MRALHEKRKMTQWNYLSGENQKFIFIYITADTEVLG